MSIHGADDRRDLTCQVASYKIVALSGLLVHHVSLWPYSCVFSYLVVSLRRFLSRSSGLFAVPMQGIRSLLSRKWFRRTLGGTVAVLLGLWVVAACVLQFWLFPHINDYRERLSAEVGRALGVQVAVGALSADWSQLHPRFTLSDVVVFDREHRSAVQLSQIKAELAWWPLLTGSLGFRSLLVETPDLDFRRDANGALFLSGLPLGGDGDFNVDALLEQGTLNLRSHEIRWTDNLRRTPTLVLTDVDLRLRSRAGKHRLDLIVAPPLAYGKPVKLQANWYGRSFSAWQTWPMEIVLNTAEIDLAPWVAWFDYPVPIQSGKLRADVTLTLQGSALTALDGDIALSQLQALLSPELKPVILKQLSSSVSFKRRDEGRNTQLTLDQFSITDASGHVEPPTNIFIKDLVSGAQHEVTFRASHLDMARWRHLTESMPLPADLRRQLADAAPAGIVEKLKVEATMTESGLGQFEAQGSVRDLAIRSADRSRYVQGISAKFDLNQSAGKVILNTGKSILASPNILPINEVPLDQLAGQINWTKTGDILSVKVKGLQLRNTDLVAEVNGGWSGNLSPSASDEDKAGTVDMKIVFDEAKTESGWKYIPLSASPDISKWVKGAITGGTMSDFRIEMSGRVWDMPFGAPEPGAAPESTEARGAPGKFYLGFKTQDVNVKYADGYPVLEKLAASFDMNQNQIRIVANKGQINGMRFSNIRAAMADVSAFENHLVVSGQAEGPTASAVSFLKDTPLADHIHHFADDMSADGPGKLDITVDLNLAKSSDVRVNGQYRFLNNRLVLVPNTPPVTSVNGTIQFSESSIESRDLQGQWSGEPLAIRVTTDAQGASIQANGRASIAELRHYYDLPIFEQVSGRANWQANVMMRGGRVDLNLSSDLRGVASALPEPFNKGAAATMLLSLSRQNVVSNGRKPQGSVEQIWRWTLGNAATGVLGMNARAQLVRGKVIIGSGQALPALDQTGLQVESLKPVDLDFWLRAMGIGGSRSRMSANANANSRNAPPPLSVSLKAPVVKAFGHKFQDFKALVQTTSDRTAIQMASRELQGDIEWLPPGVGDAGERGLLQGRLSRLDLTAASDTQPGSVAGGSKEIDSLPDLSFRVDELLWQGQPWGKLSFKAKNQKSGQGQSWRVDPFQLEGPDLRFTGRLNWVNRNSVSASGQGHLTSMDFKLNSSQVGNLLTKLGYPGTVKRGTAAMEGQVSWPGSPFGFDPARLSGNFKMTAKNGQFSKMDPGVGRLLGLLSLQSLPQRLTLDFRDIFSDGLAFESIDGRFDIRDGLMKTSDLQMDAPAAKVLMRGETNLASQTQDVIVTVRPALSNSVALGVTVLNPIAGAATFLAQKVLDDPLSKVFSYQYHITGTWSDPLVDKESLATDTVKAGKAVVDMPGKAVSAVGDALSKSTSTSSPEATSTSPSVKQPGDSR